MARTIRPAAATDAGVIYELMCQLEDTRLTVRHITSAISGNSGMGHSTGWC